MAWIAAAAAVGGSIMSNMGQSKANKQNAALAKENRMWQQRMSNTAHQRQARDLKAAGLNRILGVSKSGASTPAGNVAKMDNELGKSAEILSNSASTVANVRATNAQTANTMQQTKVLINEEKRKSFSSQIEQDKFDLYQKMKNIKSDKDNQNAAAKTRKKHNLPPVKYFSREELKNLTKGRKPDKRKKN